MRQQLQQKAFEAYSNKDIILKSLVRLVVSQRLPLSIVEWPSFHTFVLALNPYADQNLMPSSHTTMRTAIMREWLSEKLVLQRHLQTALSQINVSLDIWTSPNRILFLGVVAHFVRGDSTQLQKNLLGLRQIGGHSGEDQFNTLRVICEEYGIWTNLGAVIGDNATTNDTLCRTISQWFSQNLERSWDSEIQRIRCLGHIINLIVQAFLFSGTSTACSLEELESYDTQDTQDTEITQQDQQKRAQKMRAIGSLGKLHNIVVHIRASGGRTEEFTKSAGRMIPLDNRTRWNSWYHMGSVAIKLEKEVDFYVKNQPDLKKDSLDPKDWEWLRTIVDFLKTFRDLTLQNEGDNKDLSGTLPSMFILRWEIQAFQKKFSDKQPKTNIDKDFVVRAEAAFQAWQKWWDLLWVHPSYQIAVVLHPFYRTNWIKNTMKQLKLTTEEQAQKLQWLKQIWLDYHEEALTTAVKKAIPDQSVKGKHRTTTILVQQAQSRSIESLSERIFGSWASADDQDEYDQYISEPAVKGVKKTLEWWRDIVRRDKWPILTQFAIEKLSYPPMSAEVERIFSGARRTISWDRSRLQPDIIEALECFQHWLDNK
jgi:hypothetical protein